MAKHVFGILSKIGFSSWIVYGIIGDMFYCSLGYVLIMLAFSIALYSSSSSS